MLDYLDGKTSDRKLRLFACACVRRYWSYLRYRAPREAVEVAERYAEGEASDRELEQARERAELSAQTAPEFEQPTYVAALATVAEEALEAARQARESIRRQAVLAAAFEVIPGEDETRANLEASRRECRAQCELLREVFGNPFRRVRFDPAWLSCSSGAGGAILQAVWQEQRFEDLPYLADALTDAGCDEEALLRHLREPAGHVRGCWAIDLLMGLE
jgi:hypothetical protein